MVCALSATGATLPCCCQEVREISHANYTVYCGVYFPTVEYYCILNSTTYVQQDTHTHPPHTHTHTPYSTHTPHPHTPPHTHTPYSTHTPHPHTTHRLRYSDPPVLLGQVQIPDQMEVAKRYGVEGYPLLIVFRYGREYNYTGPREEEGTDVMISSLLLETGRL